MNAVLAIEVARCKMREMGHGDNYTLRVRTLFMTAGENRVLSGGTDLFILIEPFQYMMVQSKHGVFNLQNPENPEVEYIHSGKITITNLFEGSNFAVMFLQVIPLNQK